MVMFLNIRTPEKRKPPDRWRGGWSRALRSRQHLQALHGLFVQPFGMHAGAGALVAQALGDGLGLICLGIWYGQPCKTQADGNDQDQGFK